MMFELETKIDGNDKVRHAQINIDNLMSASTKPYLLRKFSQVSLALKSCLMGLFGCMTYRINDPCKAP